MFNPKVKTTSSTSTVSFRNTQGSYYDMIISIQNQTIDQSISITDTEGNNVTENPIALSVPAKVILKDVQVGTITFSDSNSYNVIISYIVKKESSGIPYIDIDYQSGFIYTQETGTPVTVSNTFTGDVGITMSPPSGKKWILRSIVMRWQAGATGTDTPQVQIYPSGAVSTDVSESLNLLFASVSTTADYTYVVDLAKYVQSRSATDIEGAEVTEQMVTGGFEVFSNELLSLLIGGESATVTAYISYIEVNLG
ncbi:MAG: hypothetical protein KIY10_09470 [Thermoplasmata archaeon]|nr:hypothetical protein [Candidatus Sysuiplasma jiujiangense]